MILLCLLFLVLSASAFPSDQSLAAAPTSSADTRACELRLSVALEGEGPAPKTLTISVYNSAGEALTERTVSFAEQFAFQFQLPRTGQYSVVARDDQGRSAHFVFDAEPLWSQAESSSAKGPLLLERSVELKYLAQTAPKHSEAPRPTTGQEDITWQKVFFATDRAEQPGKTAPANLFGPERSDTVSYGTCMVSFPPDHQMGQIERPKWWKFQIHLNPEKHVMLQEASITPQDSFFLSLDDELTRKSQHRLLIFVHGYNTDFEGAVLRAAQLTYDVQFPGASLLFTWASRGSTAGYLADEATSDWSTPHFETLLDSLTRHTSADAIEIVAHSMGTRIVTAALKHLRERNRIPGPVRVSELALAAADLDAGVFREFAQNVDDFVGRTTLYGSSNDKAIDASRHAHDAPRAGDGGQQIMVIPGVQTVDASAVKTDFIAHSYFADNTSMITDLRGLLQGLPISQRCCLAAANKDGIEYWIFQP